MESFDNRFTSQVDFKGKPFVPDKTIYITIVYYYI